MEMNEKGDIVSRERDASLAKIPRYEGESAQDCMTCGLGIDSRRQVAIPGCQLCTACASELEKPLRGRR